MRRILICSGVLGGGTALVFGAAALTAVLIPAGRIVPQNPDIMFARPVPAAVDQAVPAGGGGGWAGGPAPAQFDGPAIVTPDLEVELPAPEPVP